ncbi:MAG: hypothetical protein ACRDQ5_12765 [Sciscionella sp.]
MSPAGDNVGKAARSGVRTLKRGAARAGQVGAQATSRFSEVAEQKLTERGLAPQQLAGAVAENAAVARDELVKTTRRARKKIEKNAKGTRKELTKKAKKAGKKADKRAKDAREAGKKAGKKASKKIRHKADKKAAKAQRKLDKKSNVKQRRRRVPILLGLGAAAATVYVVRSKANNPAKFEHDTLGSRGPTPTSGAPEQNGQHSPSSQAAERRG